MKYIFLLLFIVSNCEALVATNRKLPGYRMTYFSEVNFTNHIYATRVRHVNFDNLDMILDDGGSDSRSCALRFEAQLRVPKTGDYVFHLHVDERARVLVGNSPVLPRWVGNFEKHKHTETVHLTAGEHPLVIEYANTGGRGKMMLQWQGPDLPLGTLDGYVTTGPWSDMDLHDAEAFADNASRVAGLRARFYRDSAMTAFDHEVLVHECSIDGITFADSRTEFFAAEWIGHVVIPKDGEYRFTCRHDDAAAMVIDGHRLWGRWDPAGGSAGLSKGSVTLQKGVYPIRIRYNQGKGRSLFQLRWSGPGFGERSFNEADFQVKAWPNMKHQAPLLTVLFVGHSNLQGHAEQAAGPIHPRVWIHEEDRWRRPHSNDRGPIRPLLARLAELYPDYRIGGMKVAQGGSSVERDWRKGKRLFAESVQAAKQLQEYGHLIGIVSFLGWPDAAERDEKTAQNFAQDFSAFVTDLRQAIGIPDLPWLAGRVEWGHSAMKNEQSKARWQQVYKSFDSFPAQLKNFAVVESKNCALIDNHHFSAKGYETWAARAKTVVSTQQLHASRLKIIPATSSQAQPVAASPVQAEPLVVTAKLVASSQARTPEQLGTYPNGLVVHAYDIIKVEAGTFTGKRLMTVHWATRKKKVQPAANFQPGMVHRLHCVPMAGRKDLTALPMDDDIVDLAADHWFVTSCKKP